MKKIFIILILAFLVRAALAFVVWHPDLNNHVDWGIRFWQYGPAQFYKANVWSFGWPNQPPLTILIFALIRKIYESVFSFFWWINVNIPPFPSMVMLFFEQKLYQALLKLPAILADLGIAYIMYRYFKKDKKEKVGIIAATLFLLNIPLLYNSSIWGQTDSTINIFGLLTVIFLLRKNLLMAALALTISLLIKASLLVLVPIFLIFAWRQKFTLKQWLGAFIAVVFLVGIIALPFAQAEPFSWLFALYKDKVFGWQLHLITANAFNFWALLTGIHERPDKLMLGPLTFNAWGYILFGISYLLLLWKLYNNQHPNTVLWVVTLSFFASFLFLTGMHERYLYPIFPFLTMLVAQRKELLTAYVGISIIHLVNLYNFWWYPRVEVFVQLLSAGDRMAPRVLGLIMTVIFLWLYMRFLKTYKEHQ